MKIVGPPSTKLLIQQSFVNDHLGQAVKQRHVCAGPGPQPQVCERRKLCLPGVYQDQLSAPILYGPFDGIPHDRVRGGRVGSDKENHLRMSEIAKVICRTGEADGRSETHGGRGMVQTAAVINIIRPQNASCESLKEIVLFIRAFGRELSPSEIRKMRS